MITNSCIKQVARELIPWETKCHRQCQLSLFCWSQLSSSLPIPLLALLVQNSMVQSKNITCKPEQQHVFFRCYAALGMDMTRDNALSYCQKTYGAYARLTAPMDVAENNFVTQQVQSKSNSRGAVACCLKACSSSCKLAHMARICCWRNVYCWRRWETTSIH